MASDEYAVELLQKTDKASIQQRLNEMFDQGWEFVESHRQPNTHELLLIFRKVHRTR